MNNRNKYIQLHEHQTFINDQDTNEQLLIKKFAILHAQLMIYDNSKQCHKNNVNQLKINQKVHIYSRANNEWCPGTICHKYIDEWLQVEYTYQEYKYIKDIHPNNAHIIFSIWTKPNTIVITTLNVSVALKLKSKLIASGRNNNVACWDPHSPSLCTDILKGIINIIIVSHDRWPTDINYLINNVDLIFEWSWRTQKVYKDYDKMLKSSGLLTKICKGVQDNKIKLRYIKEMLGNADRFVNKLFHLIVPYKMQIPVEIQQIIVSFVQDKFVITFTKDEIST